MTAHKLKVAYVSPAYAKAVAEKRARKATGMFLMYLEYKAGFARSSLAPFLSIAPYEHFLEMLDYFPDPQQ